jgi:hypothetical protein
MATGYVGIAIGGPKKGLLLANYDRTIQMARMERNVRYPLDENLAFREIDRGHYEFDAGHWWWKGWSLKR